MSKRFAGILLGILLVLLLLWANWLLGYFALILFLAWIVGAVVPERYRPLAIAIYISVVIVLVVTTFLHDFWVLKLNIRGIEDPSSVLNRARSLLVIWFRAFLISLALGTIVNVGLTWILLYLSAEHVLALPAGLQVSRQEAMRYLFDLLRGKVRAAVLVDEGRVVSASPPLRSHAGGAGIVTIRPMNAVILRTAKGQEPIGPGAVPLQRYDRIEHVVDLRQQGVELNSREVMTQDKIPLSFRAKVWFQVSSTSDPLGSYMKGYEPISGAYPVYKETISQVAGRMPVEGLRDAILAAAEVALRDVVGTMGLTGFMSPTTPLNLEALGRRIAGVLDLKVRDWGMSIRRVDVIDVTPPRDVRNAALELWRKQEESKLAVEGVKGESRALLEWTEGIRSSLLTETDARRSLFEGIVDTLRNQNIQVSEAVAQQLLEFVTREVSVFSSPGMRSNPAQRAQDPGPDQGGFGPTGPPPGQQTP